jgi:aerobic carbon-monoxide dehydrogenase medium subunit
MSMEFAQPGSLEAALNDIGEAGEDGKIIAGGTAVALMLRNRLIAPGTLISLDRIESLRGIHLTTDGLAIGAMTRLHEVAASIEVHRRFPALAAACAEVGNVRVRNQATLGGNLAEADYASDPPTVLLALDACVRLVSAKGERLVPISEFFLGFFTTALVPDEILTEIVLPDTQAGKRMVYLKYRSRSSEDRPCVGVAAVAGFDDGACTGLSLAVGAACETPRRVPEVEARVSHRPLEASLMREVADGYADTIEPLEDLRGSAWYRTRMIRVFVRRALEEVVIVGR